MTKYEELFAAYRRDGRVVVRQGIGGAIGRIVIACILIGVATGGFLGLAGEEIEGSEAVLMAAAFTLGAYAA